MPGPGEGPEYEELALEQADGGSDGVSRGSLTPGASLEGRPSTAPGVRSRRQRLREARNDKLHQHRELVHVELFDHNMFACFGSNVFVAFLHVYFVLGESSAPTAWWEGVGRRQAGGPAPGRG